MNARIANELVRPHAAEAIKAAPKHGASAFDHALQQIVPKAQKDAKHETPSQSSRQPQQQAKQEPEQQQQPARSEQDELRNARILAALHGVPLTQLVVPRAMPATTRIATEAEPAIEAASAVDGQATSASEAATQDEIPTSPGVAPKATTTVGEEASSGFELPDGMEPTDEPSEDTLVDLPQPEIDPAQVAQLIASTHAADPPKTEETRHDATVDVAALQGATRTNVAEPTRAIEAAAPVRDVEWHGLAETIANGSIEGNRARVVIGQGDSRIVLTVSTHAHRVSLDVETSTPAGQQLAEQLRGGSDDLRHALQKHGLDLADQRAPSQQQAEHDEPPVQLEPKKQVSPTIARPAGVVA